MHAPSFSRAILARSEVRAWGRVVRRRRKAGFDAPLTGWLRGPLRELVRDVLHPRRIAATGFLEPSRVTQLIDDHESGSADHAWRIWSLLVLCDWSTRHGVC